MNKLLRKILVVLLSVCAINGFAQQHASTAIINSIKLEGVDMTGDDYVKVCYTVSFNSPLKIGDKVYCYITPVDINDKPFPDGKGSFLTAGGLYNITQRGSMSLTIAVPAVMIRQISGKDEYHLKVNVMPEKDDDFFLEDLYAFSYSDLKQAVCADAMQASLGILNMLFGGTDSESSGTFLDGMLKTDEFCNKCQGTGKCPRCHGEGECSECGGDGRCQKCNGAGRIRKSNY